MYEALDVELERRVAIKVVAAEHGVSWREGKLLARLNHPGVVRLYDHGSQDDFGYLVLELLEGVDGRRWLSTRRSSSEVLEVFERAGEGLAAAHRAGVIHGDFKPENMMVCAGGRVAVVDFGLAASTESGAGDRTGTLRYLAPERMFVGGRGDESSDQFAFCVALWEALAGRDPFQGSTVLERLASIQRGIEASDLPDCHEVLARGMSPEPERRWGSMNELLDAMRPVQAQAVGRPLAWAAGIAFAFALGLGLAPYGPTTATAVAVDRDGKEAPPLERALTNAYDKRPRDALDDLEAARARADSVVKRVRAADTAMIVGELLLANGDLVEAVGAFDIAFRLYEAAGLDAPARDALARAGAAGERVRRN